MEFHFKDITYNCSVFDSCIRTHANKVKTTYEFINSDILIILGCTYMTYTVDHHSSCSSYCSVHMRHCYDGHTMGHIYIRLTHIQTYPVGHHNHRLRYSLNCKLERNNESCKV